MLSQQWFQSICLGSCSSNQSLMNFFQIVFLQQDFELYLKQALLLPPLV